ncbi:DgyrCDS414 [Dimorphilus gyrociliatus]|uniref:DgyrCDS414 n=1 Tax=Dimorphilus gyrociliatus TaxID=2664684 RepID=A0A7I8V4K1_9ANNE|nr:DgyrCDS414 [Dimorphilus gyrociliatus]
MDNSQFEVVFFIGPPHCGKTRYFLDNLKDKSDFIRFDPNYYFLKNPDSSFRQGILECVNILKKNNKVVIDSENLTLAERRSFTDLIKRKIRSTIVFKCIIFQPQNGLLQLRWAHQAYLSCEGCRKTQSLDIKERIRHFLEFIQSDRHKSGLISDVNKPSTTEFSEQEEKVLPLTICTVYQWVIPVLFIDYNIIDLLIENGDEDLFLDAINFWLSRNSNGILCLIKDSTNNDSIPSKIQQMPSAIYIIEDKMNKSLTDKVQDSIAYMCCSLYLNIAHNASLYIYKIVEHSKAAHKLGMKTIRIEDVLKSINSLVIQSRCARSNGQEFWKSIQYAKPLHEQSNQELEEEPSLFLKTSIGKGIVTECHKSILLTGQPEFISGEFSKKYSDSLKKLRNTSFSKRSFVEDSSSFSSEDLNTSRSCKRKRMKLATFDEVANDSLVEETASSKTKSTKSPLSVPDSLIMESSISSVSVRQSSGSVRDSFVSETSISKDNSSSLKISDDSFVKDSSLSQQNTPSNASIPSTILLSSNVPVSSSISSSSSDNIDAFFEKMFS